MCLAPSAIALTVTEASSQLGLKSTAPGAPATEITVQMVNDAYVQTIRGLLGEVTTGNPGAVAASHKAAEARLFLLRHLRGDCEIHLFPLSEKKETNKKTPALGPDLPWLHSRFPELFPENFDPLNEEQLKATIPSLVAQPQKTLSLLALTNEDIDHRLPDLDPNSLSFVQHLIVYELRLYLRPLRLSNPSQVKIFENAVIAEIDELKSEPERLSPFLRTLATLNLTPGQVHIALVPLLQDPNAMTRAAAYTLLTKAAIDYGLPPNLETALIESSSDRALVVLARSKKLLLDETYKTLFARLPWIQDRELFGNVIDNLLQKQELRPAVFAELKAVRDNAQAPISHRLHASRDLIEAKVDAASSEQYILSTLPNVTPDERFLLFSWCLDQSSNCSRSMRSAIKSTRVGQSHQALEAKF